MSIFCNHEWKEIVRSYAEPYKLEKGDYRAPTSSIEKTMFGVTTILWECQKCKEMRKIEMLGREVSSREQPQSIQTEPKGFSHTSA